MSHRKTLRQRAHYNRSLSAGIHDSNFQMASLGIGETGYASLCFFQAQQFKTTCGGYVTTSAEGSFCNCHLIVSKYSRAYREMAMCMASPVGLALYPFTAYARRPKLMDPKAALLKIGHTLTVYQRSPILIGPPT